MGLRTRFARWLNGAELNPADRSASVAPPTNGDLLARIEKLELERPAFVLELESLLETAQDILDRAESKRGRAAADASRQRKREEAPEQPELLDREAQKANVRRLMIAQGKLSG
jgi:hypothetical protein